MRTLLNSPITRFAGLKRQQCFFIPHNHLSDSSSLGVHGLKVDNELVCSVRDTFGSMGEISPQKIERQTKIFFINLAVLHRITFPKRMTLLEERGRKQVALNDFFTAFHKKTPHHTPEQLQLALEAALKKIGYLSTEALPLEAFRATTTGLAKEIHTPGPQAVVPADKANMVVNAVNGRWGSAYEAVKGSNLLNNDESEGEYVHKQLGMIFEFITSGQNREVVNFSNILTFNLSSLDLTAIDKNGNSVTFLPKQGQKFLGYTLNEQGEKEGILLENNSLKIEIKLDKRSLSGRTYPIKDIILEASQTVIIDKEDSSVSATKIKKRSEENIAKLINGTLTASLSGGRGIRRLNSNTQYLDPLTNEIHVLKRTAQILVRGVGDHLTLPVDEISIDGQGVFEKTWDLLLSAMTGVQYHVLPKMRNEKEVTLTMLELELIETALDLPENYFKVGIMNEEFEMNLRLREALNACRQRVFFVNSGFLDKFGSDLEATIHAGAVDSYRNLNKAPIKLEYEKNNVSISMQAGIAQVGAGMWPKIKDQSGHKESKDAQILSGNDVSWNPDPKFSVLHALCYHTNPPVKSIKLQLKNANQRINEAMLYMPPLGNFTDSTKENYISKQAVNDSLREATFGLIGYATPWITMGIGCSAINDLNGNPLMEDRATARIKVAFLRNWLHHDIMTKVQLITMIEIVSKEIPGVTDPVKNAILELIFNPENRLNALVEESFMKGYQAANGENQENTDLNQIKLNS